MELLEQAWDGVGAFFNGATRLVERGLTGVFGSANARYLKKLQPRVEQINELEPKYRDMSDEELRSQTDKFRARLAQGETLDDILPEAFAVCREGGRRFLNMRHYDVQLIGGMVLHNRAIAEMVTGEGKTLVATLPAYLNALTGEGVHVITVNDYLARRDMEWMGPLYIGLGLTVGTIQANMPPSERQRAYTCDITYGTNNEFGFDYLRDNMRSARSGDDRYAKPFQQVQRGLNYAIVDEVDNILIDEARTPLIISGPAHDNPGKYSDADRIARQLQKNVHFEVKEKEHTVHLTDEGVREAEKLAGVESFYTAGNMEWPHLIDNSLKAHHLYIRDVNYVVEEGKVVIVDEFTGRKMEGRQWSDGLHQAVEAKERVKIKEETQTLATITLQNFFKLYDKICGMTGTAMTEANEFWKIYKLDVVAIPTNRPMKRLEQIDVIYGSEREKYSAVADEVERLIKFDSVVLKDRTACLGKIGKETDESVEITITEGKNKETKIIPRNKIFEVQRAGRPILIGTVSIEKSERLSRLLDERGVKHEVLNAKNHRREAEIIAQAGRKGAVTIATNMAGRGTDIVLGGNPETYVWAELQHEYPTRLDVPREVWEERVKTIEQQEKMKEAGDEIKTLGGLRVIGTERHESRRIDLQLRGRCGRQGDPGSSRFFLSLEDDLMRVFGGGFVKSFMERMGMPEGEAIENSMVSRRVQGAQKKVEERNFEIRKNLLEYDEVMDEQRKRVYHYRQLILDDESCKDLIFDMIRQQVNRYLDQFLDVNYGQEVFAKWASAQLRLTSPIEVRDIRGMDYPTASQYVTDQAERSAESDIFEKIEESLPEDAEEGEWNWDALAHYVNTRWETNVRVADMKRAGRERLDEMLIERSRNWIAKVDLSEGEQFMDEQYGLRNACGWVHHKFGIQLNLEEVQDLEVEAFKDLVYEKACEAYRQREIEYPIMAALYRYSRRGAAGQSRLDREEIIKWANKRFEVDLNYDEHKNQQRAELREELLRHSVKSVEKHEQAIAELDRRLAEIFDRAAPSDTAEEAGGSEKVESLANWAKDELKADADADELGALTRDALRRAGRCMVDDRYRLEMTRMEREVLLQIVDSVWKDHLLAMDHLLSYIRLVGFAQLDAKVEYKREGMRAFDDMWQGIGDRMTDLIFRIENLDENFVRHNWVETEAQHADAGSTASSMARERMGQQQSGENSEDTKPEPIRKVGRRVGRNEPCPCNSGKKYKSCCMRKDQEEAA